MNEIEAALQLIDSKKKALVKVTDPTEIFKGMIEIDSELHKLAKNLKILAELEYLAGNEAVRLEQIVNQRTLELATEWTKDRLEEIGIVRSDKFKYVKSILNQEYTDLENMRLKYKYFKDIRDTYQEWINVYKKTRTVAA